MTTTFASSTIRPDLFARITDKLVSLMEQGVRPWMRPWSVEAMNGRITRPLRHNGEAYRGINVLILWAEAVEKGWTDSPYWLTLKQANAEGGRVRKGEHGTRIVYASSFKTSETDAKGEEVEREIPFLKEYTVFHVQQIDGLGEKYRPTPTAQPVAPAVEDDLYRDTARFFEQCRADIRVGGNQAFYASEADYIRMPPTISFYDREGYYATLAHEMIHWTKHPSRLDRDFGRKQFGDAGYAKEECVAEIGSAFLCADLGISAEVRDDHAAYLDNWIRHAKEDKRFLFTAAAHAQKAADYLHSLQPQK